LSKNGRGLALEIPAFDTSRFLNGNLQPEAIGVQSRGFVFAVFFHFNQIHLQQDFDIFRDVFISRCVMAASSLIDSGCFSRMTFSRAKRCGGMALRNASKLVKLYAILPARLFLS
jgi:hypothetical protein